MWLKCLLERGLLLASLLASLLAKETSQESSSNWNIAAGMSVGIHSLVRVFAVVVMLQFTVVILLARWNVSARVGVKFFSWHGWGCVDDQEKLFGGMMR